MEKSCWAGEAEQLFLKLFVLMQHGKRILRQRQGRDEGKAGGFGIFQIIITESDAPNVGLFPKFAEGFAHRLSLLFRTGDVCDGADGNEF